MKGAKEQRFVETFKQTNWTVVHKIIVDTYTGVNYFQSQDGNGFSMTPLLDKDGKPVVTSSGILENI